MNADVEFHIRHNYAWQKLPANVKQVSEVNMFFFHLQRKEIEYF